MTIDQVTLQRVNLELEEAWSGSQAEIETSVPDSATIDSLVAHQSGAQAPLIRPLVDPTKDYDVDVYWPDFCGLEAADCVTDPCQDLTAESAEVLKKSYKITQCIESKFAISETEFWKSWLSKDKFVAQSLNNVIAQLVSRLNMKALVFLHANSGLNKGGNYPVNGQGDTTIPSGDFATTDVFVNMLWDAQVSHIMNPFIIDGKNLWSLVLNTKLNAADAQGGNGNAQRANFFNLITFDPLGFAKVPDVTRSTFTISPTAYAFVTKNYIPNSAPVYDEAAKKWKYSIDLGRYGARIDVFMQRICEDGTRNLYKYVWLFKLHYDFLANPAGCPDGTGKQVTGIIEYVRSGYGGGVIGE